MEITAVAKKNGVPTAIQTIPEPRFHNALFRIRGNAPYVQNKFSYKAREAMREAQEAGSTGKKGKKREPKNFLQAYKDATHFSEDGWCGIPASGFRAALVSACKIVGFHMTKGKLALFVGADGFDPDCGTPLIRITKGEPRYHESYVRISGNTTDIRARPMWVAGWEADLRITYDADMFTQQDVANLVRRVGLQVGIGEGRPDSKSSTGMGWGTFDIVNQ